MLSNLLEIEKTKPLPAPVVAPPASEVEDTGMAGGILLSREQRWNPEALPNAHVVCLGASGSGKTQTLKAIAYALVRHYGDRVRVIVIDFHGDQEVEGETCYSFHRASPCGINPLTVSLDLEGGGPTLQALSVIASCRKALILGSNQEGALLQILEEVYSCAGIRNDEPATWERPSPTFADVERVIEECADGGNKEAARLRLKLLATFQYGVFSRPQPELVARHTRIDLSKLPPSIAAIAAESLARQLLAAHRLAGEIEGKLPRTFLIIDEAKEMPATRGSACDRIVADGRKFGLAVVLASQSERHLSLDVIGNSATKIVLPVDQTEVRKVANKFRFAEARVAALKPLVALCRFGTVAVQARIWTYFERVGNGFQPTE
jgi:hypothetical protein